MTITQTSFLTLSQKDEIFALWNRESPANIAHNSLDTLNTYLSSLKNVVYTLVLDDLEKVIGWFADFDRDDGHWFAMILDKSIHGKGVGSQLLKSAKVRHNELNGWIIDHANDKN